MTNNHQTTNKTTTYTVKRMWDGKAWVDRLVPAEPSVYACFCEVDHDCAPVSQWCQPCRERAL